MRAIAYTLATTAMVLLLALAEWATEKLVAEYSRAATTTIEIAIVLVAALVFRPIHQRVEGALESAFYWRKHHALAELGAFRRQLTSFKEIGQLLTRTIETIEAHLEASACAIYLRREAYHPEASSFPDDAVADVSADDPLVRRFQSAGGAVHTRGLQSFAPGTHGFPMTIGGEIVGFLCVEAKHDDYDHDELEMLTGLTEDLAVAIVSLEPRYRPKHVIPNNLPVDLQPLIGRERDLAQIRDAMHASRLITITGPGGVGKTRVALECAHDHLAEHEQGAWFVDFSPISDPELVAPTILAALHAPQGDDPVASVIDHLLHRNALLIFDNCEHIIGAITDLTSRIRARCPDVTIIATSRELLHLDGEIVHRLGPLDRGTAVALFVQRASAIDAEFRWDEHSPAIQRICEHLDGMPLAIELAAARTRTLSVDEIYAHLNERFRLLTSSSRAGSSRHHTLAATIEWSYDLLGAEEQSLFVRLGTFRGSFSLAAAGAVCAQGGRCDELHVLDVLTSLADKSLLTVVTGTTTRYRLLETIREFTLEKAVQQQATSIVARQHAAYFAELASRAYAEFDTRLPDGWLEGLAPDLDNFRAALDWTLCGPGDRKMGGQLAADLGPMFLRLGYLSEGLAWCMIAANITTLAPATRGRLHYVSSMMHNNLGENQRALAAAKQAVVSYDESSDERGHVRALSQLAQLLARAGNFDDAREPMHEAIRRAEELGEPRVYASVLRRCANALPVEDIERARALYRQAVDAARSAHDNEEICLGLYWWAGSEVMTGAFDRAIDLAEQALPYASPSLQLHLEIGIASWALALGNVELAYPHARKGLELAMTMQHPLARATALAYRAAELAGENAEAAGRLLGYAQARVEELEWDPEGDDKLAWERVASIVRENSRDTFASLVAEGRTLTEAEAMRLLDHAASTASERPYSVAR